MDNRSTKDKGVQTPDRWSPSTSYAYMFKQLLQQCCTRLGYNQPVYRVTQQGSEHKPNFKAFVLVDNVEYEGDDENANRRDAEQSAAKVALTYLNRIDTMRYNISQLVHNGGGLPKNMLQDYATRMGFLTPSYETTKFTPPGALAYFVTTVKCGNCTYEGPGMKSKKDAEVNAATFACARIMSTIPVNVESEGEPEPR